MDQINISVGSFPFTGEGQSDGDATPDVSDGFSKFILALYCLICVVGITGNLLVAIVLLRVPSLRSNTSDFLVHLSIVDFTICVLVIPYYLAPKPNPSTNSGFFGVVWCRVYTSELLFWFFTMTSILGLTVVNLERYVAIVHPHKYKILFTKRKKYIMIAGCWIFAAISRSYFIFTHEEDEVVGCHFKVWVNRGAQAAFGLYSFTFNFFVPFIVMFFAQLKVISSLNRQVKMLTTRTEEVQTPFRSRVFVKTDTEVFQWRQKKHSLVDIPK